MIWSYSIPWWRLFLTQFHKFLFIVDDDFKICFLVKEGLFERAFVISEEIAIMFSATCLYIPAYLLRSKCRIEISVSFPQGLYFRSPHFFLKNAALKI